MKMFTIFYCLVYILGVEDAVFTVNENGEYQGFNRLIIKSHFTLLYEGNNNENSLSLCLIASQR